MHLGLGAPLRRAPDPAQRDGSGRACPDAQISVCAILATHERRCYFLAREKRSTYGGYEPQGTVKSLLWEEP
jgi:hypothetical protein